MARHPQAPKADDRGSGRTINDITAIAPATLPDLIEQAAAALAMATTAAEVLDAKNKAGFAYTTAKAAARFAEAKNAHDA